MPVTGGSRSAKGEAQDCARCHARGRLRAGQEAGLFWARRYLLPGFRCPEVALNAEGATASRLDPAGDMIPVRCPHALGPRPWTGPALPASATSTEHEQAPEISWSDLQDREGLTEQDEAGADLVTQSRPRKCELRSLSASVAGKTRLVNSSHAGAVPILHLLATPAPDRVAALVDRRQDIPRRARLQVSLDDGPCSRHLQAGALIRAGTAAGGGSDSLRGRSAVEAELSLFCSEKYRELLTAVQEGDVATLMSFLWTSDLETSEQRVQAEACRPEPQGALELGFVTYPDLRWQADLRMQGREAGGVGKAAIDALGQCLGLTEQEATGDLTGVLHKIEEAVSKQVQMSGGLTCVLGGSFSSQPYRCTVGRQEILHAARWFSALYVAGTLALDLLVAVVSRGGPDVRVKLGYPDVRMEGSWGYAEGSGLAEVSRDLDLRIVAAPLFEVADLRVDVTALLFDLAATAFPHAASLILVVKHFVHRLLSTGETRLRVWLEARGKAGGELRYSAKQVMVPGASPAQSASGRMEGGFQLGVRTEASVGGDVLIARTGAGLDATVEGGLDARIDARQGKDGAPAWQGELGSRGISLYGAVYLNWDVRVTSLRELLGQQIKRRARGILGGAAHLLEPAVDHALDLAARSSVAEAVEAGVRHIQQKAQEQLPEAARSAEMRKTFAVELMQPVTLALSPEGFALREGRVKA